MEIFFLDKLQMLKYKNTHTNILILFAWKLLLLLLLLITT